ncbi:maleylpyruvate isomerase family mycothiol-dependent enzyme [Actinospongicola halichondriae]|uniref:maleylpyruvate isomerase family mycothiol-dependent enzyme n=1 Tax=Actinospongicola halichondriae TaxID=3236844 RepID=UPI003D45707D
MEPTAYLDFLRADLDAIGATPADALDQSIAACPGWTVAELLGHHEGVLRFATAQLRAEPGSEIVPFDPPAEDVDRITAFARAADALYEELLVVDPTEHRPNWAGEDGSAFWFRRMAQEAAVHRWDAQAAHTDPTPIDAALAIDGVDEFADVFLPHAKRRGITGDGETVHLHATDGGLDDGVGEWMFTFTPEGVDVERTHGKGDMAVRGAASDLLLFVWNRRPIAVETFGDLDARTWWPSKVRI